MRSLPITVRRGLAAVAVVLPLCIMLCSCVKRETLPPEAEGKLIVVATIFPVADWARNVGGERVYVETLLPANASPHTFDPAPREMRLVTHSSLFLKAGLHMDDWGASLVRSAGKAGPFVVSVGDILEDAGKIPDVGHLDSGVEMVGADVAGHDEHGDAGHDHGHNDHHHHHGHSHGNSNPHFWLDPLLAIEAVQIIRDALAKVDPEGRQQYEANAQAYIEKLRQIDADITALLKPHTGKGFVSFHNAWPYMARRYQLKIIAVIEEYAGKTPSEKYLRTVTDRLKELHITTVFSEPQLNSRVAEVIAKEVGGEVKVLDPYGTEGSPRCGTYIDTMKFNAEELSAALERLPAS